MHFQKLYGRCRVALSRFRAPFPFRMSRHLWRICRASPARATFISPVSAAPNGSKYVDLLPPYLFVRRGDLGGPTYPAGWARGTPDFIVCCGGPTRPAGSAHDASGPSC